MVAPKFPHPSSAATGSALDLSGLPVPSARCRRGSGEARASDCTQHGETLSKRPGDGAAPPPTPRGLLALCPPSGYSPPLEAEATPAGAGHFRKHVLLLGDPRSRGQGGQRAPGDKGWRAQRSRRGRGGQGPLTSCVAHTVPHSDHGFRGKPESARCRQPRGPRRAQSRPGPRRGAPRTRLTGVRAHVRASRGLHFALILFHSESAF